MARKNYANCKHLTHKYASFFGCTIEEVCVIAVIYLVLDLILSIILALFFGKLFLWFIGFFVLAYFLIRITARKVGSFKENKQQGFLILKIKQKLSQKLGFPVPYITYSGRWSFRRIF